jgi:hypothetical protein
MKPRLCAQDHEAPPLAAVLDVTADATENQARKVGSQEDDDDENVEWAGDDDVLE